MRVSFVLPPARSPFDGCIPSPALATLATLLKGQHEILKWDLNFTSIESCLEEIRTSRPDVVAITVTIDSYTSAAMIADQIKNIHADCPVIVGGPHISLLERTKYSFPSSFDFISPGEGENRLPGLVDAASPHRFGAPVVLPYDIDENFGYRACPDWALAYDRDLHLPLLHVEGSRGCPYRCLFCAHPVLAGHHLRKKASNKIVDEIQLARDVFGIRHFRFTDSNLTAPQWRFQEICELLSRRCTGIRWTCFARVSDLNEDVLDCARTAGCVGMFVGIESGQPDRRKELGKDFELAPTKRAFAHANELGLMLFCNFIHGLPGDREDAIDHIYQVVSELGIRHANVNPFHLIPDSPYVVNAERWGIKIYQERWPRMLHDGFAGENASYFRTADLTQQEMRDGVQKAREDLTKAGVYWNLRDYHLLAWLAAGGDRCDLERLWIGQDGDLVGHTRRCFDELRQRGAGDFEDGEHASFLVGLREAVALASSDEFRGVE